VLIDLQYSGEAVPDKRSFIYTYRFPAQECEIRRGHSVSDRERNSIGEVVDLDIDNQLIKIRKGPKFKDIHHSEIFMFEKFSATDKENSIIQLATWINDNGLFDQSIDYRSTRDLLLGSEPRVTAPVLQTTDTIEMAIDWALKLDHSVLPIQGPPGTGKSYTAGKMIVALVEKGKKIGITALSHKVISSLLHTATEMAAEKGLAINVIQKINSPVGNVTWLETTDNSNITSGFSNYDIIAGTPFMWASMGYMNDLDYLFVDEAGQLSLIDTLSIARVAKNIILSALDIPSPILYK
jgi:uncharacterized protein